MTIKVRAFTSPTLVLLAFDWDKAADTKEFLGFAIKRTPGFNGAASSFLPNRLNFDGPAPEGHPDYPSNEAPIQKFYWWDARIDTKDRGQQFQYVITPITGAPDAMTLSDEHISIKVRVPNVTENGVTTHFNRAVISSQAFSREFKDLKNPAVLLKAEEWLANGMQDAIPDFLDTAKGKMVEGAIYHLTDNVWILPAMDKFAGKLSLAYNSRANDTTSDDAIDALEKAGKSGPFTKRTHANISHNKFLVRVGHGGKAEAVLAGSANFTTGGLTSQANVLHVWEAPELAQLYLDRKHLLQDDPTLSVTQHDNTGWSAPIKACDATVRVFFPPESPKTRKSLDAIVKAVENAKHSVLLCAFDPTDAKLIDAIFAASDTGKMMLALINRIPAKGPDDPQTPAQEAQVTVVDRASKTHEIEGFGYFKADEAPDGFLPERYLMLKEDPRKLVRVHHKFVVIDGETDNPTVFTGSANFSENSLHKNDENLLEITDSPRIAQMYFAEFLRLYEHYRARAARDKGTKGSGEKLALAPNNSWTKKYFAGGSPEEKARISMSQ